MTTTQQDAQVDDAPFGSLIWHCSDEDSGPDVGVSIKLGDSEMLWLGEITRKLHHDSGCEKLGDDTGWWIIHYRGDESRPIAKCCDEEAARDMFDRLAAALSTASAPPQAVDTGEVALPVGAAVQKPNGYPYPGIVRSAFTNAGGDLRYVVESDLAPGMLHIFSPSQIVARAALEPQAGDA